LNYGQLITAYPGNHGIAIFKKKKSLAIFYFQVNLANSVCCSCTVVCSFYAALLQLMSETPAHDPTLAYQNDSNGSSGAVPALRPQDSESTFELLLTLIYPSKCVCTSAKKTKNMKPESDNKGPYDIPINTKWDAFLGVIAEKLMVVPSSLVVTSFEWHWLKPASCPG
jgi:hypothetical protein